jgi:hypothetical protein
MKYFFFFIFILSLFSINSCTSFKKAPNKYDAYVMMKKFVDDKLLSPSSAEYEPISTIGLKQEGNIWAFDGYVDSQNSFGVMIRNNFSIAIRYNPSTDDWSLVNLFFHE